MKGFIDDIEDRTEVNRDFRRVVYTGPHLQLVLMALQPGEEIGEEIHDSTDQFFRVEEGTGEVVIDGRTTQIESDMAMLIPAGARHNVVNTGHKPMKLYTLYAPPHHEDGTVHRTKTEAEQADEHFTGRTTE
jgi:mannose-6-phosphate isomerase-like protein (cupin superfamily)